ncbi:helix-turn-helix transcriptional regulator [Fannyhessea vaginae]|uniref:helix-turn-helix domain-containing protein n=1 Tax=Fannyhessea vaginae TaxID=82135 RepID=UPI0023F07340|nr:helix-turn-helix transcriptional regulator [Fannyhessea vaginae]
MARSYNKLWKLMIDKKMNKTQIRVAANISTNAMAKIGRDESVPIETLEKICDILECKIDDILEFNNSTGENEND